MGILDCSGFPFPLGWCDGSEAEFTGCEVEEEAVVLVAEVEVVEVAVLEVVEVVAVSAGKREGLEARHAAATRDARLSSCTTAWQRAVKSQGCESEVKSALEGAVEGTGVPGRRIEAKVEALSRPLSRPRDRSLPTPSRPIPVVAAKFALNSLEALLEAGGVCAGDG